MSLLPQAPIPELTTTRTGGGRSARLVAIGVVAVLALLVYVGVSGRPPTQESSPTNGLEAILPTPAVTYEGPTDVTASPVAVSTPYPGAVELVDDPRPPWPYTWLAVALRIGGTLTLADLYDDPLDPSHLTATYQVPVPAPTSTATLELFEVGRAYESDTYGTWAVPMEVFDPNMPHYAVIVDDVRPPQPFLASPPIVANGYRILVTAERSGSGGVINVDLTVGRDPTYPGGTYAVVVGAGRSATAVPLKEDAPGRLSGRFVLANSLRSTTVDLLLRGSDPAHFLSGEHLAEVTVGLPRRSAFVPGAAAFNAILDGDPAAPNRMEIVNQGFQFEGSYELVDGHRALAFRVRMNPIYDPQLVPTG